MTPIEALRVIARHGCLTWTRPKYADPPACFAHGRSAYASYGADMACEACIARLGLLAVGEPADALSLMAAVGPTLPDFPRLARCRERGARWTPGHGWVAPEPITPETVGADPHGTYIRIFELVCRGPRHEARRLVRALDDDLRAALLDRIEAEYRRTDR